MLPSLETTRKIFIELLGNAEVPLEVAFSFDEDDSLSQPFSIVGQDDDLVSKIKNQYNWDAYDAHSETCYYNGF